MDMTELELLYQWVDEQGIKSLEDAERQFVDSAVLDSFLELVTTIPGVDSPVDSSQAIVAGCAVDLSGSLDCAHWECRQKQVNTLFRRIWHYFDDVVIVGPCTRYWPGQTKDDLVKMAVSDVQLLLYVREIGAERLLRLRRKPDPQAGDWRDTAREAALDELIPIAEDAIARVAQEAEIEYSAYRDHHHYSLTHQLFEHTQWGGVWTLDSSSTDQDARRAIAEDVVEQYVAYLAADVQAARTLHLPLGATVQFHGDLLQSPAEVADPVAVTGFELELPVVEGIDLRSLIELRERERERFEKFRSSLKLAIKERIRASGDPDPRRVAQEIETDIVAPALNDIELRLKAAQEVLSRKGKFAARMGAFLTTCGVLTGQPLLIGAGLATAAPLIGGIHKYYDDERDISLSDMYFLWEAVTHRRSQ